MTITELIAQLENVREQSGDLTVRVDAACCPYPHDITQFKVTDEYENHKQTGRLELLLELE